MLDDILFNLPLTTKNCIEGFTYKMTCTGGMIRYFKIHDGKMYYGDTPQTMSYQNIKPHDFMDLSHVIDSTIELAD